MQPSAEQIAAAIAALEAQRALLGDGVVDTALAPLRRELAALQAASTATSAQRLKQVSVLFVDVVGSTAIGQQLDPETIHLVMDSALERFTAVVRSEGGRVLQYTGDGMLAAFGTEVAAEDDVECAVRAGLGIVEAAREHAPLVRRQHRVPDFNVRVGVHTGRVLLGGGVDAEGSIRGSTVNVAARMEQSAPPGRVRISQASWRHVRGLFEAEEQEPISVKGVAQPVRSWLVVRPLPRAKRQGPRGIEGLAAPPAGPHRHPAQLGAAPCRPSSRCARRQGAAAALSVQRYRLELDAPGILGHHGVERHQAPGAGALGTSQVQRIGCTDAARSIEGKHRRTMEVDRLDGNQPHVVGHQALEPLPGGTRLIGIHLGRSLLQAQHTAEFGHAPCGRHEFASGRFVPGCDGGTAGLVHDERAERAGIHIDHQ
jgi:class 3 adenylate cyclase